MLLFATLLLAPLTAAAQPAGAQAEILFRQGRDLLASGKIAEACAAFEASQKLEPAVTTLMNLGGCRERNNQLATAWGIFVDVQRNLRDMTDEDSQQIVQVATTRAANLEPRLSKLMIHVADTHQEPKLEVLRNSEIVEHGAWNNELPIDGGTYVISARAEGFKTWSTTITIDIEKDVKSVEVPQLEKAPPPPPPKPLVIPARRSFVPLVVGGSAVALLAGALAFDLSADTTYSQAQAEMMNNATRHSLEGSANTKRYIAEGLAVTGLATGGVAVWMYLRDRHRDSSGTEKHARTLHVTPVVHGDRALVTLTGSY